MPFDPVALLDSIGYEYKVRGRNATFRCTWCGDSDLNGDNFGIRLDGRKWGCWRDRSHTASLANLIRTITGWTFSQVESYLGEEQIATSPIDVLRKRAEALGKPKPVAEPADLAFPPEFRVPFPQGPTARFYRYLEGRGFDDVPALVARYDIRCANRGKFHDRLIFPVYAGKRLVGWTARAVAKAQLRYVAEPEGGQIKDYLFNGQHCKGGRLLVLVEGPVDAYKLDFYGQDLEVSSGALMGTSTTAAQASQIMELAEGYDRTLVLLDAKARAEAHKVKAQLAPIRPSVALLPPKWKDPGEMPPADVQAFLGGLL